MYYEDDNDIYSSKSREKSTEKISGYFLLVFLASLCLLGYFSYCVTLHVPPVLRDTEAGPNRFSEERAWKYLVNIIGNGPKVAGSREHLKATRVILEKLQEIAKAAKKVVRVEHQQASGDYWLSPFVNLYHDASNVIAKLQSDAPTNTSLLLNCHYDSVPTSPGASDNMLWCAVMMEVLSIMSKQDEKIEHNVIFLFNGAEENPLQTSHTFLQHKWSKGINAVVNLDSGGMGGKASVFQVNEPRILRHYMQTVPMPSCQSAGETFFRAGLIPSDTDFRIFRDYGEIPGIDIAFHRYGQVYHTKYDSMHLIGEGVMQHSGETLLALTRSLTTSDTLKTKGSMESAVYWDYLGFIMFTYSYTTALILDILVLAVAAYSIHHFLAKLGYSKKVEREFFWAIAARILSLLAGVALVAVLAGLMYYTVQPLRYYSKTWLIVPLLWVPFFVGAIVMSQTIDNWRRNKSGLNSYGRTQLAMAATRAVWSLVLLLMLVWYSSTAPIRYVIAVPLMLTSLASLFADVMSAGRGVGGGKWLILYCSSMLPALMWGFNFVITTDALLIPILGRSAHVVKYPDLVMAALNVILALVAIMSLSGLELQFKRTSSGYVMILLLIVSVVSICVPVNPYSADYDNPSPQRYQIMHTVRNFRNFNGSQRRPQSAGLWIPHMDINNPGTIQDILLTRYGSHSIKTNFTTDDCETEIMCGLPVYTAKTMVFLDSSTWVETEGPEPPRPPTPRGAVTLLNRTCAGSTCYLDFQITGPPHMAFILSPKAGWNITTWSLSSPVQHNIEKNGRPVYYIYYGRPTFSENPEPFNLKIQLEHSKKITGVRTEPVLDFVHTAHRTHHEDEMTPNLKAFVKSLPAWIHPAIFLSSYGSYVF